MHKSPTTPPEPEPMEVVCVSVVERGVDRLGDRVLYKTQDKVRANFSIWISVAFTLVVRRMLCLVSVWHMSAYKKPRTFIVCNVSPIFFDDEWS